MNPSTFAPMVLVALLAVACVPGVLSASSVPYISSISPASASVDGGTPVTVTGAAFEDSGDLKCKWSRVEPETEQVQEKTTCGTYKSATEIVCDSPAWDEATCPYCDKQRDGSTCVESCANRFPWDSKEAHASVSHDDGSYHHNAESNHHLSAGMVGTRGLHPCPSCANEYDAERNPNGQWPMGWKNSGGVKNTVFYGHHGSRFLRTDSLLTPSEIGQGGFIKIMSQFFTIARIETCSAAQGCFCDGEWSSMQLATNQSGATDSAIGSYPIGPEPNTTKNNAMYNYDTNPTLWDSLNPPTCTAYTSAPVDFIGNTGDWKEGTKIVLDQPLYKQGGTPNEEFFTNAVYVSSKKPCVDCKCAGGCPLTLTVSNNGRTWSGGGTNGRTWHGSAAKFVAKFVIPEVYNIQFPDLEGRRDSSRMFVPATGNTRIRVKGKNFQEGPLTRCYFDTVRIMTKAEFIDSETVECQTPSFVARAQDMSVNTNPVLDNKCAVSFDTDGNLLAEKAYANDISDAREASSARLFDTECTDSMQSGAANFKLITSGTEAEADYSFSHVQVTNNGKFQDLSAVIHKRADGARSYLEGEGSPHRSTCYQLPYPTDYSDSAVQPGHEQDQPCRFAHQDTAGVFHQGNDVQIKYSTCYESLKASESTGMNYRGTVIADADQTINSTHALGQKFRIPADSAGPLVAVDLHLKKSKASTSVSACTDTDDCEVASRLATTIEACVSAGGFKGEGQTLACEWFTIQNIADSSDSYMIYFTKPPYLLGYYKPSETAGYATSTHPTGATSPAFDATYYLTLTHVSGPETVQWAMSDQTSTNLARPTSDDAVSANGFFHDASTNYTVRVSADNGFRAAFYTCDGCRWEYQSLQTTDRTTFQVGKIHGRQNHSDTYLATHPSVRCKSTATQTMGRSYANEGYDTAEGLPRQNSAEDPSGVYADECGTPTYREQYAQAIRPLEDISVTKMRTKMAAAYTNPTGATHEDRTESGDFVSALGATVSVWITEHGKLGEHVCHTFTGTTQVDSGRENGWLNAYAAPGTRSTNAGVFGATASGQDELLGCGADNVDCMHCDTNGDGKYEELCFQGALCNKTLPGVYGGCGVHGICAMSNVVPNAHVLRNHPDGTGPMTSRCGEDTDCDNSQNLKVQHSLRIMQGTQATDASGSQRDVIWEFEHPVKLKKHTTYYVNMAIDETISKSDSVYWFAGTAEQSPAPNAVGGPGRSPFLGAYHRTNVEVDGQMMFVWQEIASKKFDLEIMRCVTSLPSIESFSTAGARTGSCLARSSPRGGLEGPTITFTGRNFFPSAHLHVVFLNGDGSMGPRSDCVSTKSDFTEMTCQAPQFNPFDGVDCSVPGHCEGVHVMPSNDGHNYGPQLMSPKFIEPYDSCTPARSPSYNGVSGGCDAVPVSINGTHHSDDVFVQLLGENQAKYCFSDIYVSTSGDDYRGDGSSARPFRTIQRGIDAANPIDVITMLPGTYTGTGNRGIRHLGKKIYVKTIDTDPVTSSSCATGVSLRDQTVIDCEHSADGFVINNNKDSISSFAGFVDFSDVTTMNCENLRLYG